MNKDNRVRINNLYYLEWKIANEHMPALVTFLNSIGEHVNHRKSSLKERKKCDRPNQRDKLQQD